MIRLVVYRVEDHGAETELGELRMAEVGAAPYLYRETATGASVMRDVRGALACLAPANVAAIKARAVAIVDAWRGRRGAA